MSEHRLWTPEEITHLSDSYRSGMSIAALAALTGRSSGSVRAKVLILGLRRGTRPWSEDDRNDLKRFFAAGKGATEIAGLLERTVDAITRMCNRLGLHRDNGATPWTEAELQQMEQMLRQGHSLNAIAKATGHPRSSVADKLRHLNLTSLRFRQPWSADERHTLRRLHAAGASLDQIVAALPARSAVAIRLKLASMTRCGQAQPRLRSAVSAIPALSAHTAVAALPAPSPRRVPAPLKSQETSMPVPITPAPRTSSLPASIGDMERWLRSRDFMVLHTTDKGWMVDRHALPTEAAFIEFVNVRRRRLNLPAFVKVPGSNSEAAPRLVSTGWRSRPPVVRGRHGVMSSAA